MSQTNPTPPPVPEQSNMALILVAVGLGIVTVVLTNIYISNIQKQREGEMNTVYRLNISRDAKEKLRQRDLDTVEMHQEVVQQHGYITAQDLGGWIDSPLLRPARQGELLTFDHFTSYSRGGDLELTPGKKALPIPIAPEGRPGSLDPGMYVDVYAPVMVPGERPRSMLVLERVRLFAVGNRTLNSGHSRRSSSYGTVTLEVSPLEAEQLLTLQQWLGKQEFRLAIRNPGDANIHLDQDGLNPELLKVMARTGTKVTTSTRNLGR